MRNAAGQVVTTKNELVLFNMIIRLAKVLLPIQGAAYKLALEVDNKEAQAELDRVAALIDELLKEADKFGRAE